MAQFELLDKTFFYFPDHQTIAMVTKDDDDKGKERLRLDLKGRLLLGTVTNINSLLEDKLKVIGETSDDQKFALKVTDSNNNTLFVIRNDGHVGIKTEAPSAELEVDGDVKISGDLIVEGESFAGNIRLFTANQYRTLWSNQSGGPHEQDVSAHVPEAARGAVVKVIVNAQTRDSGSFVCADRNGNFGSVAHYFQNGFTNYTNTWVGGMVLCPFFSGKRFRWQMMSNASGSGSDGTVRSYGGLIGWF